MPIFLDRHDAGEVSAEDVAQLHVKDLEIQDKYGVKFLTYWYDATRGTTFCLVDAPNKETADRVHAEAHGHMANEMIAVDLSAGQNGYLICGKLKKDDDLKAIPIIIIGNPDGFAQHRKLKAHADDYVAKPVNADELVDRAGALIGFPELPAGEVVDDGLSLGGLDGLGDEPVQGEELAIEGEPLESHGEELALLDNPFGDSVDEPPVTGSIEEPVEAPPELSSPEDDFSGLDGLGGSEDDNALDSLGMDSDKTVVGFMPPEPCLPAARS